MKKIVMCLMAVFAITTMNAQVKQGVIVYERKLNMHKNLQKEDERIKNIIPEFSSSKLRVVFSGDESVASNVAAEPDILESAGDPGGNQIRIRLNQPEVETYKNYKQGKIIELRELGPRKYIIEEAVPLHKWQLKEETKIIKGYNCKKAISRNLENKEVIAWYTEEILCPSGPELWGGLPGMILEMNIDNAQVNYTAISIDTTAANALVKTPSGGKKISKNEFDKMMAESMGPEERSGRVIFRMLEQ